MISSKRFDQNHSQLVSRNIEINKILAKKTTQRMPFEVVEICNFLQKLYPFRILFPTYSEHFWKVAAQISVVEFQPGLLIYKEGDTVDSLFVITSGQVQLDMGGKIGVIGDCGTFGELEIMFGLQRRLSWCKSIGNVECIVFDKHTLIRESQMIFRIEEIYNFIDRSPNFIGLNSFEKMFISTKANKHRYAEGSYILSAGEISDKMLCVMGGCVKVLKTLHNTQSQTVIYEIDELKEGDVTGEYQSLAESKSEVSLYSNTTVFAFLISMTQIRNCAPHLVQYFRKGQSVYPGEEEILEVMEQQKKQELFNKKYLNSLKRKGRSSR